MNDNLPFHCYAMQTVSLGELGIPKNDLYLRNKEYIEMLATFLLLMVQSGKQGPRVLDHLVPLEAAVVRKFDFSNGTLTTEHVEYKGGIKYLEYPTKSDTVFHVGPKLDVDRRERAVSQPLSPRNESLSVPIPR
jgi:hypothetical protein